MCECIVCKFGRDEITKEEYEKGLLAKIAEDNELLKTEKNQEERKWIEIDKVDWEVLLGELRGEIKTHKDKE